MPRKSVVTSSDCTINKFEDLTEFDKAMLHLITAPKEVVDKKMAAEQANKKRKK